jgi:uncharacterized damage-inducible protein DinB
MDNDRQLVSSIYAGWHAYQEVLVEALRPLQEEQLALRASPQLRSVGEIVRHMIGARARWFYMLMGEGGQEFADLGTWDRSGERERSVEEIIHGLERTWEGMQAAIASWSAEQWQQTWPGEDASEPEAITRAWVIWHLIEHDLHHGGEISIILGAHGVPALDL